MERLIIFILFSILAANGAVNKLTTVPTQTFGTNEMEPGPVNLATKTPNSSPVTKSPNGTPFNKVPVGLPASQPVNGPPASQPVNGPPASQPVNGPPAMKPANGPPSTNLSNATKSPPNMAHMATTKPPNAMPTTKITNGPLQTSIGATPTLAPPSNHSKNSSATLNSKQKMSATLIVINGNCNATECDVDEDIYEIPLQRILEIEKLVAGYFA